MSLDEGGEAVLSRRGQKLLDHHNFLCQYLGACNANPYSADNPEADPAT